MAPRRSLVSNRSLSFGLDPNRGGGLFDICHLDRALNLSDTLTRRPEAYHRHLNEAREDGGAGGEGIASIHDLGGAGDEGLAGLLIFDRYTKTSLLDHFLGAEVNPEGYAVNEYAELGDFVQGKYRVEEASVSSGEAFIEMGRRGRVDGLDLGSEKDYQGRKRRSGGS